MSGSSIKILLIYMQHGLLFLWRILKTKIILIFFFKERKLLKSSNSESEYIRHKFCAILWYCITSEKSLSQTLANLVQYFDFQIIIFFWIWNGFLKFFSFLIYSSLVMEVFVTVTGLYPFNWKFMVDKLLFYEKRFNKYTQHKLTENKNSTVFSLFICILHIFKSLKYCFHHN